MRSSLFVTSCRRRGGGGRRRRAVAARLIGLSRGSLACEAWGVGMSVEAIPEMWAYFEIILSESTGLFGSIFHIH